LTPASTQKEVAYSQSLTATTKVIMSSKLSLKAHEDPAKTFNNNYNSTPTSADLHDEYVYAKTGEDAKEFRDTFWMVTFYINLAAIIAAVLFNVNNIGTETEEKEIDATNGLWLLFGVTSLSSISLSTVAIAMMSFCLNAMIKAGLIFSVLVCVLVGLLGFVTGQIYVGLFGVLSFLIGAYYAKLVWSRIPFAEANLKTALVAVQANWGLWLLAYGVLALALLWSTFWFLGLSKAMDTSNWRLLFGLCLSFYWVFNVLRNTLTVTVVGTVGTWWVAPDEASSCCSPAVRDSLFRSTTYSFGSICLGSLLVAFVQALRALLPSVRDNDDCACLACILDCLLSCIEEALEYLNKVRFKFLVKA